MIHTSTKKSEIAAKNEYDFQWLTKPDERLMPLSIVDEGESLRFEYDEKDFKLFDSSLEGNYEDKLVLLIGIGHLNALLPHYSFQLNPENIYFSIDNRINVKFRDIQIDSEDGYYGRFLKEYKAIIASALQTKYSYEDYIEGGESLLKKDKLLSEVYNCSSVDSIQEVLKRRYVEYTYEKKNKYTSINKTSIIWLRVLVITLSILLVLFTSYGIYHFAYIEPYKDASISLHEAYVIADYPSAISSMSTIDVSQMTVVDKYLLAISYVKTENLTAEQKTNIVNTLSVNDYELRLDYWIYLGRGMTDMASDIAMQLSDDQLLLYSYMRALELTELDSTLTGEEKQSRINQLNSAMTPLVQRYDYGDS